MKAIVVRGPGGPDELELRDVAEPSAVGKLVLIDVHATALNRVDLLQRRGLYPPPPGESEILGLECAGVVSAIGREVTAVAVGDRVMALLGGGGYAERVAVHERLLLPIPEVLSFEEAAAVPEAFLTAYQTLLVAGELAPGERVLAQAAASGVGLAAVQIARELGAYVFAAARSPEKVALLGARGAQRAIDVSSEDLVRVVLRESAGKGVDVIADLVGGAYAERHQALLATGGRWVVVGLLSGTQATIDLRRLLAERQTVRGVVLRSRSLPDKTRLVADFRRELWPWLAEGRLRPCLDSVLPLAEARAAHERMEANANFGKIVLRVR